MVVDVGGGGDTGVPISHIPDVLPPNIPYPIFHSDSQILQVANVYAHTIIPYPISQNCWAPYPISQICYPPISHIPYFTVNPIFYKMLMCMRTHYVTKTEF